MRFLLTKEKTSCYNNNAVQNVFKNEEVKTMTDEYIYEEFDTEFLEKNGRFVSRKRF